MKSSCGHTRARINKHGNVYIHKAVKKNNKKLKLIRCEERKKKS